MDQRKARIAEHFSETAQYWRDMYVDHPARAGAYQEFMKQRREATLRLIAAHAAGRCLRIIDIGCGTGPLLAELARQGHQVVGVDLAAPMLERARSALMDCGAAERPLLARADAEQLPFASASFDAAGTLGLVEYLASDAGIVDEVRRLLRPGGLWVMSAPNLLKAGNVLDPYYYCVRGWQFAGQKLGWRRRRPPDRKNGTEQAVRLNESFACRRFLRGHWPEVTGRSGFEFKQRIGIGYGPFTVWQRGVLSPARTLRMSAFMGRLAACSGLQWIDFFSNRWVYAFVRSV